MCGVLWLTTWSIGSLRRPVVSGVACTLGIALQVIGSQHDQPSLWAAGLVLNTIMAIYLALVWKLT